METAFGSCLFSKQAGGPKMAQFGAFPKGKIFLKSPLTGLQAKKKKGFFFLT